MRPLGVGVSVVEPGAMATEIWGKGREQLSSVRASLTPEQREVYGAALEDFDRMLASRTRTARIPARSPRRSRRRSWPRAPDDRYLVGRGTRAVTLLEPLLPSALFDRVSGASPARAERPAAL